MNIAALPTDLTKDNINNVIAQYRELLKDFPLLYHLTSVFELSQIFKREKIGKGPYPNVSLVEATNKIMTDLVILCGVKELLNNALDGITFDTIHIEYGRTKKQIFDITAKINKTTLYGEAFNVSMSLFQKKKNAALNKLRKITKKNIKRIIVFNSEAIPANYTPVLQKNEYFLPVDISTFFTV